MSIVLTIPELAAAARDWRREGAHIVLAAGCFDPLHLGHVQHLEAAKRMGNVLVVSVAGDRIVREYKQRPHGPKRPFMPADQRAGIVAALGCVDGAVVCNEDTCKAIIRALKPHVYAKGEEYREAMTPALDAEGRALFRLGGRMEYISGPQVFSSSAILAGV